jgi:UvrD-like helicase C-terminal domain/Nuclease-related domain
MTMLRNHLMARCIPDTIPQRLHVKSEARLFERLRRELPDDYVLIHSLNIPGRALPGGRPGSDVESDFVLLHPQCRLVLEVKGGGIECVDGLWSTTNKTGKHEITPPFHQARFNSFDIYNYLKDKFGAGSLGYKSLFGYAIILPDVDLEVPTIEGDPRRIIGKTELEATSMRDIVERQIAVSAQMYKDKFPDQAEPALMTPELFAETIQLLRPDLRLIPSLSADQMDKQLLKLSAEQMRSLNMMDRNPRLRVTGGPGSGKTLLAFETCRRELKARPDSRIGLMCFNRHLGSFLADVSKAEGVPGIDAGSFYSHCDRLIGNAGDQTSTDPAYFRQRVTDALSAARGLPDERKFDLLVVDEGQDFRDDGDKLALMGALLKGGLSTGRWRWFEDMDQILSPEPANPPSGGHLEYLQALEAGAEALMVHNWRNTDQIGRAVAKVIGRTDIETSGIPGPAVVSAPYTPGRELELLNLVLAKHVLPKHLPKDIVVLSLRGAGKESYAGAAELGGLKAVPYDPAKPYEEGTIRTSTVFKFKGMESHVVVLTDLDKLDTPRDRRRAYVGMSRAKYALYTLGSPSALSYISG